MQTPSSHEKSKKIWKMILENYMENYVFKSMEKYKSCGKMVPEDIE